MGSERPHPGTFLLSLRGALGVAILAASVPAIGVGAQEAGRPHRPADHADEHRHEPAGDGLGAVHFPITCTPEVQPAFDRALALLHSFGYEVSREAFQEIVAADPSCGMAWWGVAMTYYHPIWAPPSAEELAVGREAAQEAARLGARSEEERAFIEAIGAFYRDADRADHRTRASAYSSRLEQLALSAPRHVDAQVFFALSLLATAPANDPSHAHERRAGEILNRVLPGHEEHPGIVHLIIHSFDYPELADLALPAARAYARIAPASPHARHMPSHIFTRLGLWEECIASNLASEAAADEQVARTQPGAASYDALHALDYLAYAYLQTGRVDEARAVAARAARARTFDVPNFAAGYALAAVPARLALEQRDWAAAAALEPPEVEMPWERFTYALATSHFARAVGAASIGKLNDARAAIDRLAVIQEGLAKTPPPGPYDWAGQVESLRLSAAGWLARAEGNTEQALVALREAADLQDRVGKHPVTPGEILPARELLGDLLLELGRAPEALAEYQATLVVAPNRAASLRGVEAATRAIGGRG
jgi:tetratricopeptide (TPR) repeat protein